ncbi:MAG: oligosaccharide flippase family protein [Patescibacteria group bacterium]
MGKIKAFLFNNTSTRQTIVKNTFWLFLGEILGRILKFAVVLFATRALGVERWGVFSYAIAFVSLTYIFADIGINTFVTRELSKEGADRYTYLSAALALKLLLLAASFIISLLLIPQYGSNPLAFSIVVVIAVLNFSDSLREFYLSINRALLKMEREAYIKVGINVVTTAVGIVLLMTTPTPLSLGIAYMVGSVLGTIAAMAILPNELIAIKWNFPLSYIKIIFDFAWPFIALTIFSTALVTIDSIMLGQITSASQVGMYAAAQRIIQFLAIIPLYIGISLFPLLAKKESAGTASVAIFEKTMTIVLGLALPIALGGFLLSGKIMTILFGSEFAPAGTVLAILMVVIIADFAFIILNNIIYAKNLQKKFILATIIGLVLNICLNIYLIPHYGAAGAAIATATAQMLIMALNWIQLKRFFAFSVLPKLTRIIAATAIMGAVIMCCNGLGLYFSLTVIIAIISYAWVLYLFREPSLGEITSLFK